MRTVYIKTTMRCLLFPKDDQQARMKILSVGMTMDQEALLHIADARVRSYKGNLPFPSR